MRAWLAPMIAGALALTAAGCSSEGGAPNPMGVLGKEDAPVKVIEIASMSCGHCAHFNNTELPKLKAKYIDTGKVRWEMREMLTPPNELSAAGFLLARCAGKERYFAVVDAMYHNLEAIGQDQRNGLLNIARSIGMTDADFDKCITDEGELKALTERVEKNAPMLHTGTPTFWIDGKKHTGQPTAEELTKLIDAALAKS